MKEYRFEDNPTEKVFYDNFKQRFGSEDIGWRSGRNELSAIVFGWTDNRQSIPKEYLTELEESICLNLIQWLGSPVGQGFLNDCGFVKEEDK